MQYFAYANQALMERSAPPSQSQPSLERKVCRALELPEEALRAAAIAEMEWVQDMYRRAPQAGVWRPYAQALETYFMALELLAPGNLTEEARNQALSLAYDADCLLRRLEEEVLLEEELEDCA